MMPIEQLRAGKDRDDRGQEREARHADAPET